MSSVEGRDLAHAAMRALSAKHPNLTMQQLALAMRDAEWTIEGDKATCAVRIPAGAEEVEIAIVPADQS